jgi:hypothetical protein
MLKTEGNNCGPRDIGNTENQEPGFVDSFTVEDYYRLVRVKYLFTS